MCMGLCSKQKAIRFKTQFMRKRPKNQNYRWIEGMDQKMIEAVIVSRTEI